MKHPEGHGLPDSAALAERDMMRGADKDLGHGITDEAAIAEGQFMHRAEHEEAEHEAAAKRGLSDDAAVWEHDLIHGAEVSHTPFSFCRRMS